MNSTALFLPLAAVCFGALCAAAPVRARGAEAEKSRAIPEVMRTFIDKHEIAGAVTLVATCDKVLALDAVGDADVAGHQPMRTESIFWIASMTKPITGAAIMMLQDEGKLSIDDPVAKYLPELAKLKTPDGKPAHVTLRHLLTHTSGMADLTPEQTKDAKTLAELIPLFAELPLHFEPGAKWSYCQSAINSLGRIVEVVSGQSLPDFFQQRIFGPLGMKDTTFYLTAEQLPRLAKAYKLEEGTLHETDNFILQGHSPTSRDRYPAANGGLFSTASDYVRYCQMVLNAGTLEGKQLLKPETVKQMTSIQSGDVVTGFTPGNGWGCGCCVVREPQGVTAMLSPGTWGHGGAYGTQAWTDPAKGIIYIMMVQRANFANGDASDVRKGFQEAAAAAFAQGPTTQPLGQAADGSILLHAKDVTIHGTTVRYEPQPHKNTVGYWTRKEDWVSWTFEVKTPGKFELTILQGCGTGSGGSEVEFTIGQQTLKTMVQDTGGFQNFVARPLGTVELPAGTLTLNVKPISKPGVAVMDLRQVTLTPVK